MKPLWFVMLLSMGGCAALPECPKFQAQGVVVEGQFFAVIDRENVEKLNTLIVGLDEGRCRLPK